MGSLRPARPPAGGCRRADRPHPLSREQPGTCWFQPGAGPQPPARPQLLLPLLPLVGLSPRLKDQGSNPRGQHALGKSCGEGGVLDTCSPGVSAREGSRQDAIKGRGGDCNNAGYFFFLPISLVLGLWQQLLVEGGAPPGDLPTKGRGTLI